MTTKLIMHLRHDGTFIPADEIQAESLDNLPRNTDYQVELKRPRNPRFHRLAFALFQTVLENTDDFMTLEALKTWLKVRLAYADPHIGPDGKVYWQLRSLSYASMDETTFRTFFNDAVDLIVKTWGFERPALLAKIENSTGLRWSDKDAA